MDERKRWLVTGLLAVVEATLGVLLAARREASPQVLGLGWFVATAVCAVGAWQTLAARPIFRHRWRSRLGLTVLLLGAMIPLGLAGLESVSTSQAVVVAVGTAGGVFALVWACTTSRRAHGWLMRTTAARYRGSICPECGMATNARDMCEWCGAPR